MSKLRTFTAYANTTGTVALNRACNLVELQGNYAGPGNEYLVIVDQPTATLAAGAACVRSMILPAAGPLPSLFETLGPIPLSNGCFVAISTTAATYTASGSSADLEGALEDFEIDETNVPGLSTTTVGDTVTGVDALAVWANGATTTGLHSLREILVTNGTASVRYLMLFTVASPPDGSIPLRTFKLAASAMSKLFRFGGGDGIADSGGFIPFRMSTANAFQDGCFLAMSTTGDTLTNSFDTNHLIQVKYV